MHRHKIAHHSGRQVRRSENWATAIHRRAQTELNWTFGTTRVEFSGFDPLQARRTRTRSDSSSGSPRMGDLPPGVMRGLSLKKHTRTLGGLLRIHHNYWIIISQKLKFLAIQLTLQLNSTSEYLRLQKIVGLGDSRERKRSHNGERLSHAT